MKNGCIFLLFVFVCSACASSGRITRTVAFPSTTGFEMTEASLKSGTHFFGEEAQNRIIQEQFVSEAGTTLLKQVVHGYTSQLGGLQYTDAPSADVRFRVTEIEVTRAFFTLNIPHPGPIYKVRMTAEIYENGQMTNQVTLQERANMSEVNFSDEHFKWLNASEKNNTDYQVETFKTAVKKLYQKLYFHYFDISLQL